MAFLFLASPYLGKGNDTDRGSIADGRVRGVQSRSLEACRSTSRMTSPCALAMRPSTKALFGQGRGALHRELTACLRTGRVLRMIADPDYCFARRGRSVLAAIGFIVDSMQENR